VAFLTIMLGDKPLHTEPLKLTQDKAIKWLSEISRMDEFAQDQQYLSLLALEHLHFSMLLKDLPKQIQKYYYSLAKKMQLDQYLTEVDQTAKEIFDSKNTFSVAPETLILWKALRDLNGRLSDTDYSAFEHIQATIKTLRLCGAVKGSFIKSVIPLLCSRGQLLQLRQLVNFSTFYKLDDVGNSWEISLLVALLVADGEVDRAAEALWKINKQLEPGWLNTECVYYAITHTIYLEANGEIEQDSAMHLYYAFIGLLDAFNGEWFSRLHDQLLIKTMVVLLEGLGNYPDQLQHDIIKSSIRHYGLTPVFWDLISKNNLSITDSLFLRANQYWLTFYQTFDQSPDKFHQKLPELQKSLRFFMQQNNLEALIYLREVVVNSIQILGDSLNTVPGNMIRELLEADPMEVVRISASHEVNSREISGILESYKTVLFDNLRLTTERKHSTVYGAQIQASKAIKRLQLQHSDEIEKILHAYQQVQSCAAPLNNTNAEFLSADVLASGFILTAQKLPYTEDGLMRLDQAVRQAISKTNVDFYLPAPVCAAISAINTLPKTDLTQGWLQQIMRLLDSKFGSIYNSLFDRPSKPDVLNGHGFPKDTLLVIYSCKKYLDSRVKAIRSTWLKDIQRRGIPYVILVGDGDDTLKNDILALNVSDTYEKLPQKTLKLFNWIYKNTQAQYVLKIDDDCYLDVDRYFDTLSYRKFHYYGRIVNCPKGVMNRMWHHSKSQSEHAQKAIDKSPEPSIYADGAGAYCLSRIAIVELLKNTQSTAGRRLTVNSFMEDKLVGDLLSMSNISPSNEDYECYQRRRTFEEATPVGIWENTFFPSKLTPTKVAHLDFDKDQKMAHKYKKKEGIWPKKLWPTFCSVSIKGNANQLELLTESKKTNKLLEEVFFVVTVVRNEMIILPHFLAHYRNMGCKAFIITDNCSDDGSREYLLGQPDVLLYSTDTEYKQSYYGVAWQQAILSNHCLNKWVLIADADEMLVYPDCEKINLLEFINKIEEDGADCMRTDMIDMYPYGDLMDADFLTQPPFSIANWFDRSPLQEWRLGSGGFSSGINLSSSLHHRINTNSEPNAFASQKYALIKYKPWMRFSQGLHSAAGVNVAKQHAWFAHFKYHAGFKVKIKTEIRRAQYYDNAKEYRHYAEMLAETKNCFGKDGVSKKYISSKDFVACCCDVT